MPVAATSALSMPCGFSWPSQQLPGAMEAAAQLLAETTAQHNLSSSNGSTSNSAALPGSCTHSSSTSSCSSDGPSVPALSDVFLQARAVLYVYRVLHNVWPPGPHGRAAKLKALAPAAAPAVELMMASVHAVDQLLQLPQTLASDDLVAAHLMLTCVQESLLQLFASPDYNEAGEGPYADTAVGHVLLEAALPLQAAKTSPKYLLCLSYSILVLSIASMPALQQFAADQQAAGSAEALLDDVVASLLQQADFMQQYGLPPSQRQLAALLDLQPRTLVWAAAAAVVPTADSGPIAPGQTSQHLTTLLGGHRRLSRYLHTCATPQQLQIWTHQQQHWERDLGLLQWGMSTVLQWAASLPSDDQHARSWCTAVSAAHSAVLAWEAIEKAFLYCALLRGSLLQGLAGSDSQRLAELQQQESQWTDCLLLPSLQLSAVMCQHTQQLLLSGSSGSVSTAGSSSGGQGPASGAVTNSRPEEEAVNTTAELSSLLSSLASMVKLQVFLVKAGRAAAEEVVQQDSSPAGPSRPLSAAAAPHLTGLLEALEGFTRCVAAACATHPGVVREQVVRVVADVACMYADSTSHVLGAIIAAGLGSIVWRQLYSLMTSLVEVTRCCGVRNLAGYLNNSIGCSALMIASACAAVSATQLVVADMNTAEVCPRHYSTTLPSLVVVGHMCSLWAQQLQQEVPTLLQQPAADAASGSSPETQVLDAIPSTPAAAMCLIGSICTSETHTTDLETCITPLQKWLAEDRVSAQMAAAGYKPQQLQEQLKQLLEARRAAADCRDQASLDAFLEKLHAVAQALSVLAVEPMCNNPGCNNVSGQTELGLVSGRSCKCSGCRIAHYCCRSCQRVHWKQHKPVCRALVAAQQQAAAASPA